LDDDVLVGGSLAEGSNGPTGNQKVG
jgi:hypothetical protein